MPVDLASIDRIAIDADDLVVTEENRAQAYETMALALQAADRLKAIAADLESKIVATVPFGDGVELGGKLLGVYREVRRYDYDHDGIERSVLDSRVADRDGVVVEETVVDKLRAVYPHRGYNARVGELKRRNIDIDEFCRVEKGRLRLREIR